MPTRKTIVKAKDKIVSAVKVSPAGKTPGRANVESLIESAKSARAEDAVVRLFETLSAYAYGLRASDIHIEPDEKQGLLRLRVDGILRDDFTIPLPVHVQLIARLKILTRMRTDEHHAPQDGRFKFSVGEETVDVRASIIPTTQGEKAVLRLLSSQSHKLSLEQLGLAPNDLARVQRAIKRPWGMILATGPTGSGKTTTIYAILEILNKREVNISTIEDPVEFEIKGVNQSQVDQVAKLTFATGLRSLLRQDPDIIMVGEIRDQETAKIAVNASMTGHKLLSTLHTNDSATTIPRLIDMGVEPFLVASTLNCSIAQRLVRRTCPDCRGQKSFSKKEAGQILAENVIEKLFEKKSSVTVAEAKGCSACGQSGYRGRLGIYEVLENSEAIQKLIIGRASSAEIKRQALAEGMTTIEEDGIRKIVSLDTTVEEFIRVMQE
ncbi:type II/IV secretion system protein [Candidatus Uhrbacteria bacterium]|nr:type II/IV secretion system protein [Candidatus Uhrbacteria bacterium]